MEAAFCFGANSENIESLRWIYLAESTAVIDPADPNENISNYNNSDILDAISVGHELMFQVRAELIQNYLPSGQNASDVINLFNVYDW